MNETKQADQLSFVNGQESKIVPIKASMNESGHRTLLGYLLYDMRSRRDAGQTTESFVPQVSH